MRYTFVLSSDGQPLDPCHPARARQLLRKGRAAVVKTYPFVIRLKDRTRAESVVHPHRVKLDPGSRTTGIAVLREPATAPVTSDPGLAVTSADAQPAAAGTLVWTAELHHRGHQVHQRMLDRAAFRRGRRLRKVRNRPRRFLHRRRPTDWLPPSLESRVGNVLTWARRLARICPITVASVEAAKFDTQRIQNPEIAGAEYQRGDLFGCELWEYLLAKWGHRCAYCGATGVPLQKEHIVPRSRGGSDRASNLCPACEPCNKEKDDRTAAEFGHPDVQARAKAPLRDAAAVNITRWAISNRIRVALGVPVEVGTGGRTKFNRQRLGVPKSHWADAACVGASTPDDIRYLDRARPVVITAMGYGNRQLCGTDKYGFPIRHRSRQRTFFGFRTGDLARAAVPGGKYAGSYTGRVVVRARPQFRIAGVDVHPQYLRRFQRADGYAYDEIRSTIEQKQRPVA